MIHKINDFHAVSDEGFSLCSQGRDVWVYAEGDHTIWVTREAARFGGDWGEIIYLSDIPPHWSAPYEETPIAEPKRKEIAENIRRSLEALGVRFRAE